MSPKTSPPQTLVALRLKALFFLIWHSALKRGVVVAPQILDFSIEKSPQNFLPKNKKKRPFQVNSFISGSLQPEAEGSPAPDIIAYALIGLCFHLP